MTESQWAKKMAQEFKAGRARKIEEDAKLQEEQRTRKASPSKFWTEAKEAFKAKARTFNAAVGEDILTWEGGDADSFALRRKDIEGSVKASYSEAAYEIKIEVLGRVVPLQVALEHRTGKYQLVGASGQPSEPDDLAEALIGEFLGEF
jgi:hypothetical protein